MQKRLIIGQNSRVVRSLGLDCDQFDMISHQSVSETDFTQYEKIFLFSFPKNKSQINEYSKIIYKIPSDKLIFISTIAVSAMQKRKQWNFYPNWKYIYEREVLARGGSVLRLGVFMTDGLRGHFGTVPTTTPEHLSKAILWDYRPKQIYHAYSIYNESGKICLRMISRFFYAISCRLPPNKLFQIPLQGFCKLSGIKYYGYTADALNYYADTIQIGYGALGSSYYKYNKNHNRIKIIASDESDLVLNDNGFSQTLVGKHKYGLGRKWHGVSLRKTEHFSRFTKKVPLFVKRPFRALPFAEIGSVECIQHDDHSTWKLVVRKRNGSISEFFANRIVLAAGPTENIRLLSGLLGIATTASDHETAYIGSCTLMDAEIAGLVQRKLRLFSKPHHALALETRGGVKFVIEGRPSVPSKAAHAHQAGDFYQASTIRIVMRLLAGLSISRLNEALFNKLGFGFSTAQVSLFVQCLVEDSVSFAATSGPDFYATASRRRLSPQDWSEITDEAAKLLPSFGRVENIASFDSLHILGGTELLGSDKLQALTADRSLTIVGSPTSRKLDARHHTVDLLSDIRKSAPLLVFCPETNPRISPHFEISNAVLAYRSGANDKVVTNLFDLLRHLPKYRNVLFQKTWPGNLIMMPILRLIGRHITYYVHEPLSLQNRLRKGVPPAKAAAVTLLHRLELPFCHRLLTGNPQNTEYFSRKLHFAPLLFPPIEDYSHWSHRSDKILYFGRLDEEKFFSEFNNLNLPKRVIATANLNVGDVSYFIRSYSVNQKNKFFCLSKFIWAVQKHNFSQSGVVVDAIRSGCVLIINQSDPLTRSLHPAEYIAVSTPLDEAELKRGIERYNSDFPEGPGNRGTFERIAGSEAYRRHWEQLIG